MALGDRKVVLQLPPKLITKRGIWERQAIGDEFKTERERSVMK